MVSINKWVSTLGASVIGVAIGVFGSNAVDKFTDIETNLDNERTDIIIAEVPCERIGQAEGVLSTLIEPYAGAVGSNGEVFLAVTTMRVENTYSPNPVVFRDYGRCSITHKTDLILSGNFSGVAFATDEIVDIDFDRDTVGIISENQLNNAMAEINSPAVIELRALDFSN